MLEQGINVVAGVDLGDKHSHICLIRLDGGIVERKKIRSSQPTLEKYFGAWAAMRVVFEAGARMGLRPKRRDSGERSPELSITKSGDRLLRRLLVQCAQYILGHHGEDSALRRWGLRLAARGGKAAKRKAVVAVARKLAVLLHVLWKRDIDFDPFYGTSPQAAA